MIGHQNFGNMGGNSYTPPPGYRLVPDERLMTRQQQLEMQQRMYGAPVYPDQNQMVPPQKSTQTSSPEIPARVINNENEILPNEVPSDMTPALFLQNDMQVIYAAAVNRKGTIDHFKYVLEESKPDEAAQNETQLTANVDFADLANKVMARLDDVMAELDQVKKMAKSQNRYHKPYYNSKAKEAKQND